VEWHQPSRIIGKDFDGEMFQLKGDGIDLLVTPDHRMVVKPTWKVPVGTQKETGIGRPHAYERDGWSFRTAESLPLTSVLIMPKAGNPIPGDEPTHITGCPSEPFLRFLGWWIAEGCWASQGIGIVQAQGDGELEIDDAITGSGLSASSTLDKPSKKGGTKWCRKWYVGVKENRSVVSWIRQNCGYRSDAKRIPEMIFELSPRLKRIFLETYLKGDGSKSYDSIRASTASPILKDQLQRLAVELGIPTHSSVLERAQPHHKDRYQIQLNADSRKAVSLRRYRHVSRVSYRGLMWCLTVPTGAYFVRRRGSVCVSGNSAAWKDKVDHGVIIS
jgi:hypothetical protein